MNLYKIRVDMIGSWYVLAESFYKAEKLFCEKQKTGERMPISQITKIASGATNCDHIGTLLSEDM